jgi:ferredoxin
MFYLNLFFSACSIFLTGLTLYSSVNEKHIRAIIISTGIFFATLSVWYIFFTFNKTTAIHTLNIIFIVTILIITAISLYKKNPEKINANEEKIIRFDERDHMFSRNKLQYHPDLANIYYAKYPEKKEIDNQIRQKPGLLAKESKFYHYLFSKAADAVFSVVSKTHNLVEGEISENRETLNSSELTKAVIELCKYYGAVDAGITALKKYHLYSHHGRNPEQWGKPVNLKHKNAIVIIVKMDLNMIDKAPATPAILESSKQYLESAKIAYVIAELLRSFGFEAKAHVDGKYDLLCAPLAEDANLGLVGRMGIFMHKDFGPSVRISVVTTNADLEFSQSRNFSYMEEFCNICKKCADNCPTGAITKKEKPKSRGFSHWFINQERCFSFWNTIGTDCAFCIKVCPFTKPNTLLHKLARWYISRNNINRQIALLADDFLYGRKIKMRKQNPKNFFN